MRVLAAEGCEVVAPAGSTLLRSSDGARRRGSSGARSRATRDRRLRTRRRSTSIVTNAGGCGSNVSEYGHQLRDDPQYAERAATFSAKCKDVTEFLDELGPRAPRQSAQDACRVSRLVPFAARPASPHAAACAARGDPRRRTGGDLPKARICCGSAGIYNLVQPKTADTLGDRKAQLIAPLQPDVVATGNIGCMLQIARRAGATRGRRRRCSTRSS